MIADEFIIGVGYGAEQSHYTRKPFWKINIELTPKVKVNRCNRCEKDISKRQRYCFACKKYRRLESQRKWRKLKRTKGR